MKMGSTYKTIIMMFAGAAVMLWFDMLNKGFNISRFIGFILILVGIVLIIISTMISFVRHIRK